MAQKRKQFTTKTGSGLKPRATKNINISVKMFLSLEDELKFLTSDPSKLYRRQREDKEMFEILFRFNFKDFKSVKLSTDFLVGSETVEKVNTYSLPLPTTLPFRECVYKVYKRRGGRDHFLDP